MNPHLKSAPRPLIDQLEHLGNPLTAARSVIKCNPDINLIAGAFEDLIHSFSFLVSYNGSGATFNSYRREVERLLQWCWLVRGVGLG